MRLLSPATGCVSVDVPIGRERRYRGRTIEVSDPAHIRALREVGYTPGDVAGSPARTDGRTCESCGFRGYFTRCGRCGGRCTR